MQKKTLIIVIALIIIVAGFLGYSKLAGKTSTNPSITIETEQNKKGGTNLLPKTTSPTQTEQSAGNSICDKITDPTAKAACESAIKSAGQ